jgi:hypothetical protein
MPPWPVTLDTKGRVRTSPEQRRVLLAEFARSGWSAARFAHSVGLKYSTFVAWVARARRPKRSASRSPLRLVEAVVTPPPTDTTLQVHLPGGAHVELRDASHLPLVVALVRALEKSC